MDKGLEERAIVAKGQGCITLQALRETSTILCMRESGNAFFFLEKIGNTFIFFCRATRAVP